MPGGLGEEPGGQGGWSRGVRGQTGTGGRATGAWGLRFCSGWDRSVAQFWARRALLGFLQNLSGCCAE